MRRSSIILVFFAAVCGMRALAQAPATVGPERGTLMLIGGGAQLIADPPNPVLMHKFVEKFVELAGGPRARIVFIPTGGPDEMLTPDELKKMRVRVQEVMGVGLRNVIVMHTRDRKQADSAEFTAPLREATGVWIGSGKDAYLLDAYLGTRVETEIKALLARGGVVAGNSAGAAGAIQGSLDIEGTMVDSPGSSGGKILYVKGTCPSLGLLKADSISRSVF